MLRKQCLKLKVKFAQNVILKKILMNFLLEKIEYVLKIYVNPLVSYIWIGTIILILGSILLIIPNKKEQLIG